MFNKDNEPKKEQVRDLSIDLIDDPDSPVRTTIDENTFQDLVNSIKLVGLIQPIVVRPKNGRYEVVAGHRRFMAARVADFATIPCIVRDLSDTDSDIVKLHENFSREDVNPVDEARFLASLTEKYNLSIAELSQEIGKSEAYVRSRLEITRWDPVILAALENHQIDYSSARWIAKIENDLLRRDYLQHAVESGITSRTAKRWYEISKQGKLHPNPTPEDLESIAPEVRHEVYSTKCEICGEPIPKEEQGLFFAHEKCIRQLRAAVQSADSEETPSGNTNSA